MFSGVMIRIRTGPDRFLQMNR